MAETASTKQPSRRSTKIGKVVSTKMSKTIVVEVVRKKAHPLYRRGIAKAKRVYAHDEAKTPRGGDHVGIEETTPTWRLKRWGVENNNQTGKAVAGGKEDP